MPFDDTRIADQDWPAHGTNGWIERRLQAYFRADPGGIPGRDCNDRLFLSHARNSDHHARKAVSIASTYSSPSATTSIEARARSGNMVSSNMDSDADAGSMTSAVVMIPQTTQASAMIVVSSELSPAVDTVTTRSAVLTSSSRFSVSP